MFGKHSSFSKVPAPDFLQVVDGTNAAGAAANYSMTLKDRFIYVYESNGTVQAAYAITLPTVSESAGMSFTFLAIEDLSIYNVTIQDQDESAGWADVVLNHIGDRLTLYSDGLRWHKIVKDVGSLKELTLITTYQVLPTDNGRTFLLNLAAGFTVTLPLITAVNPGFEVKFRVYEPPSGGDYVIDAASAIGVMNGIKELAVTTGTDGVSGAFTDITFADGVAILGDWVSLISDGTNWIATGQTNATVAVTLA